MTSSAKYLNAAEIRAIIGEIVIDPTFVPMSQDSYNETAVLNAIQKTGKASELCLAAINMACVGFGNKRYGNFRVQETVIDIANLMNSCGTKTGQGRDAKLSDSDLTPQRLCRAFRHEIRDYIKKTKFETYLYRKYSDRDPAFAHVMFRGSEYLDDLRKEEIDALLRTYETLDIRMSTSIQERVIRVFQAKNYLKRTVA